MTRRSARTDGNQGEIVAALRAAGALVLSLHRVGQGCPDLLAARGGTVFLLEVKEAHGALTDDQRAFIAAGWPVQVVRTPEDALRAIGALE